MGSGYAEDCPYFAVVHLLFRQTGFWSACVRLLGDCLFFFRFTVVKEVPDFRSKNRPVVSKSDFGGLSL